MLSACAVLCYKTFLSTSSSPTLPSRSATRDYPDSCTVDSPLDLQEPVHTTTRKVDREQDCVYFRDFTSLHACTALFVGHGSGQVDSRGGQLQIAGVVVGNWGPNIQAQHQKQRGRGGGGGRGDSLPPQVTSVGPRRCAPFKFFRKSFIYR